MIGSSRKRRRGLLALLAVFACVQAASAQGLRQVGNDAFGMTIDEIHPGESGIRVKVLIENLTNSQDVFLHHEADQLNAQDFFFLPAARKNRASTRNTFVLKVAPAGTASADLFFPIDPGANPGLLILGSNRPPFEQVAVALGPILKGRPPDEVANASGLVQPLAPGAAGVPARPTKPATKAPIHSPPAPRPPAPAPAPATTPVPGDVIEMAEAPTADAPRQTESITLTEAPPVDAAKPPAPVAKPPVPPARPAAPATKPVVPPPAAPAQAAKPVASAPAARPQAAKPPAEKFYTPPGAPPQTRWVPVDDEPAAPVPRPKWTTPAGAPPQTGWIPVDDVPVGPTPGDRPVSQPAAPPKPPVAPRPQPNPQAAPKAQAQPMSRPAPPSGAQAPAPPPPQAARPAKPKIVFLPNTPGDRVLQIYNTPHVSLGDKLVLRQGKPGRAGYGWSRIREEHPDVGGPDIAMAATYPHQVWSDGRTLLYLRWSEDQNGAIVLQVAGDLIVNAQWAGYDELLYWLGPGRIYPRLMYQGAR